MKRVAIKRSDGNVTVMMLIPKSLTLDGDDYSILHMYLSGDRMVLVCSPPLDISVQKDEFDSGVVPGITFQYFTPEECIAKWPLDHQANVVSLLEIQKSDLPQDRTFRNAWEHVGPKITVNMPRARDIHRDVLRSMRAPILVKLDIAYQRADETNNQQEKSAIIARKQALRDVTDDPAINAAQTPEELKAVIPPILKG